MKLSSHKDGKYMKDYYKIIVKEKELMPCKLCGKVPVITTAPIRGYEPEVFVLVKCSDGCWCYPRFKQNDTIGRSIEEAVDNVINQWNNYMS